MPNNDLTSENQYEVVHANLLRGFDPLVSDMGSDAAVLRASAGMLCDANPYSATYRQLAELLENSAQRLEVPDFGLRLAKAQGGISFGLLTDAMRHTRNFGDAVRYLVSHAYAHSLAAKIWLRSAEDGYVKLGHDILLKGLPRRTQLIEQLLLLGHLGALEMTGGAVRTRRVHFRHQPHSDKAVYRGYFGCDIRFGENEDCCFYNATDLKMAIVGSNADILANISQQIEGRYTGQRPPTHAQVRGAIMRQLWFGVCSNASVADELGMHIRSLHRRLREEQTSFSRVKDEVRRDLLIYYLEQTSFECLAISERLGFAEQAVMSRFCRKMLGMAPLEVRGLALGNLNSLSE